MQRKAGDASLYYFLLFLKVYIPETTQPNRHWHVEIHFFFFFINNFFSSPFYCADRQSTFAATQFALSDGCYHSVDARPPLSDDSYHRADAPPSLSGESYCITEAHPGLYDKNLGSTEARSALCID